MNATLMLLNIIGSAGGVVECINGRLRNEERRPSKKDKTSS